ncbi:MAG TPA: serine hydrolase domain-containing protein [Actinomycetota bacterium]|nr:serine hydrolase domain-containing protein [Actinomycetota bacterium]
MTGFAGEHGLSGEVDDLASLLADWPVQKASVGVTHSDRTLGLAGDPEWVTRIASVAKLLVGMAALVAVEEGTIHLDEPAGPEGSTVRHLLAHASGLAFDGDAVLAPPGRRRIYSNTGIERFADHLAANAGMSFDEYLRVGVLEPLGMRRTELRGSPAHAVWSTVSDLLAFSRELLQPSLVSAATLVEATRPQFPDLAGMLPDIGRFDPNPWGLTFEIRDHKQPHWTGRRNSPSTFGHFGGTGSFLWVDPKAGLATVALADRDFGPWSLEAWPPFSDAVLERYARAGFEEPT